MTAILVSLAVLLGGAVLTVLPARRPRLGLLIALSSIVGASLLCVVSAGACLARGRDAPPMTLDWPMPLGEARLALDGLSAWFLVGIALLSLAVAIYAWAYLQAPRGTEPGASATGQSAPVLGTFLCLLVAALILVVTAADVVLFLVGWESVMLASFFLVSFHHRRTEVRRAAWIYLIANHLGTALFVLPLFGILAVKAGTLDFQAFRAALQGEDRGTSAALFLLGLLGFGTKAGFMPMHVWLPEAHPAAPTPVSALLSGVVIKAGVYGLLRLLGWLPALPIGCALVMLGFGMVSGVLGVLYALAQHDMKRLLAYHSVENIGIIGLGLGMGMLGQTLGQPAWVALGYGGALLHVLNHALFKGLLFLSAGAVIHATGTGDLERLGGLARKTPINAGLFLLAAVSICGLPPFNGFVSEWLLYGSLFGGAWSAAPLAAGVAAMGVLSLALMGALALACFAKVFGVVFLGEPRDPTIQVHSTPSFMRIAMFIPAGLCVAIGVLPGVFVPLTASGVRAVTGMGASEFAGHARSILAPVGRLSLLAVVSSALVIGLGLARRLLVQRRAGTPASPITTWGCGFARPSGKMQYTASSFAWSLIQSFRSLLWPHREVTAPAGPFAAHAELETHTPDVAEHDFFAPLLRGVNRIFRMIRTVSWSGEARPAPSAEPTPSGATRRASDANRPPLGGRVNPMRVLMAGVVTALRRGRIHACMAFIVLTLLVVFFIEALFSSREGSSPLSGASAPPAASGVGVGDGVSK